MRSWQIAADLDDEHPNPALLSRAVVEYSSGYSENGVGA
jgi:hypothetical protein